MVSPPKIGTFARKRLKCPSPKVVISDANRNSNNVEKSV